MKNSFKYEKLVDDQYWVTRVLWMKFNLIIIGILLIILLLIGTIELNFEHVFYALGSLATGLTLYFTFNPKDIIKLDEQALRIRKYGKKTKIILLKNIESFESKTNLKLILRNAENVTIGYGDWCMPMKKITELKTLLTNNLANCEMLEKEKIPIIEEVETIVESRIAGILKANSHDSDLYESIPIACPYFENQKLKVLFIDGKFKDVLKVADLVLEKFLALSFLDKINNSKLVEQYYLNSIKFGYSEPLNILSSKDIWKFVTANEIIIDASNENGVSYLCVSCSCVWEEEHGLNLVFTNGNKLTRAAGHDGHYVD